MKEPWLTDSEQRAWRAYLSLQTELTARLNRQLQLDSQLSLADYEVLVSLSEAPDGRLRPFELSRQLKWEQSRLSHHLARMQRRELVRRDDCCADGRGLLIALTDHGRSVIEAAAPAHAAAVRRLFFDALTHEQVRQLEGLSTHLLGAIQQAGGCPTAQEVCPESLATPAGSVES